MSSKAVLLPIYHIHLGHVFPVWSDPPNDSDHIQIVCIPRPPQQSFKKNHSWRTSGPGSRVEVKCQKLSEWSQLSRTVVRREGSSLGSWRCCLGREGWKLSAEEDKKKKVKEIAKRT